MILSSLELRRQKLHLSFSGELLVLKVEQSSFDVLRKISTGQRDSKITEKEKRSVLSCKSHLEGGKKRKRETNPKAFSLSIILSRCPMSFVCIPTLSMRSLGRKESKRRRVSRDSSKKGRRDLPVDLVYLHPVLLLESCELDLQLVGFLEDGSLVLIDRFSKGVEDLDLILVAERDWSGTKKDGL